MLDRAAHKARKIERASPEVIEDAISRLTAIVEA